MTFIGNLLRELLRPVTFSFPSWARNLIVTVVFLVILVTHSSRIVMLSFTSTTFDKSGTNPIDHWFGTTFCSWFSFHLFIWQSFVFKRTISVKVSMAYLLILFYLILIDSGIKRVLPYFNRYLFFFFCGCVQSKVLLWIISRSTAFIVFFVPSY
jgi:hypothetical protein